MPPSPSNEWKTSVKLFLTELEQKRGLHSVKELCRFLLEHEWTQEVAIEYVKDSLGVSLVHYEFHRKWGEAMAKTKDTLEQDQKEMEAVTGLLEALQEQLT
ncbi:hypothetical protein HY285_01890 [Candidatus Peregrinibacteria bacterium]|nr:hypothetical protein [Candidatus Peregrinibacteria bacterium]MBI3816278.1 hypothetical protein [Candidatus Peregrinibacteria bacterium]